jgi:hypothetical protein
LTTVDRRWYVYVRRLSTIVDTRREDMAEPKDFDREALERRVLDVEQRCAAVERRCDRLEVVVEEVSRRVI